MIQLTDNAREYLTNQTESQRKRSAYLSVLGGGVWFSIQMGND